MTDRVQKLREATQNLEQQLKAAGALTVGAAFAEPAKAASTQPNGAGPEPTSWADSAMPEVTHRMIETNGIRVHVAEQGEGPLVILCHGFPECWYSWRHQLGALASGIGQSASRLGKLIDIAAGFILEHEFESTGVAETENRWKAEPEYERLFHLTELSLRACEDGSNLQVLGLAFFPGL